jgi:hypothetical protein
MRYLLALAALILTSCIELTEKMPPLQKACTLMGMQSQIVVDLGASSSRSAFLAAEVDGTLVDECDTSPVYMPSLHRTDGRAYLNAPAYLKTVDGNATDEFDLERKMDLKLYGRATCADPLQLLAAASDLEIRWTEGYPNGPDCGADGMLGQAELE